jgi:hypothetical protein
MTVRQPRYSKEEFAQRGDEIYESQARSLVVQKTRQSLTQHGFHLYSFLVLLNENLSFQRVGKR